MCPEWNRLAEDAAPDGTENVLAADYKISPRTGLDELVCGLVISIL
jgi:hypothetical protein